MIVRSLGFAGILIMLSACADETADVNSDSVKLNTVSFVNDSSENRNNNADSILICYGLSSGMCIGYCEVRFGFHSWGIEKVVAGLNEKEQNEYPPKHMKIMLRKQQYDSIYSLFDKPRFLIMEDRIGCPGCNDLPVEWISYTDQNFQKTVLIQSGMTNSALEPLLSYLRNIVRPYTGH